MVGYFGWLQISSGIVKGAGLPIGDEYAQEAASQSERSLFEHWPLYLYDEGFAIFMFFPCIYSAIRLHPGYPAVGHQNGTCRMGDDPTTNVLDAHCKAHDPENLYVVDASCFVSASAVNPSHTIIANAIRVTDHLLQDRLR